MNKFKARKTIVYMPGFRLDRRLMRYTMGPSALGCLTEEDSSESIRDNSLANHTQDEVWNSEKGSGEDDTEHSDSAAETDGDCIQDSPDDSTAFLLLNSPDGAPEKSSSLEGSSIKTEEVHHNESLECPKIDVPSITHKSQLTENTKNNFETPNDSITDIPVVQDVERTMFCPTGGPPRECPDFGEHYDTTRKNSLGKAEKTDQPMDEETGEFDRKERETDHSEDHLVNYNKPDIDSPLSFSNSTDIDVTTAEPLKDPAVPKDEVPNHSKCEHRQQEGSDSEDPYGEPGLLDPPVISDGIESVHEPLAQSERVIQINSAQPSSQCPEHVCQASGKSYEASMGDPVRGLVSDFSQMCALQHSDHQSAGGSHCLSPLEGPEVLVSPRTEKVQQEAQTMTSVSSKCNSNEHVVPATPKPLGKDDGSSDLKEADVLINDAVKILKAGDNRVQEINQIAASAWARLPELDIGDVIDVLSESENDSSGNMSTGNLNTGNVFDRGSSCVTRMKVSRGVDDQSQHNGKDVTNAMASPLKLTTALGQTPPRIHKAPTNYQTLPEISAKIGATNTVTSISRPISSVRTPETNRRYRYKSIYATLPEEMIEIDTQVVPEVQGGEEGATFLSAFGRLNLEASGEPMANLDDSLVSGTWVLSELNLPGTPTGNGAGGRSEESASPVLDPQGLSHLQIVPSFPDQCLDQTPEIPTRQKFSPSVVFKEHNFSPILEVKCPVDPEPLQVPHQSVARTVDQTSMGCTEEQMTQEQCMPKQVDAKSEEHVPETTEGHIVPNNRSSASVSTPEIDYQSMEAAICTECFKQGNRSASKKDLKGPRSVSRTPPKKVVGQPNVHKFHSPLSKAHHASRSLFHKQCSHSSPRTVALSRGGIGCQFVQKSSTPKLTAGSKLSAPVWTPSQRSNKPLTPSYPTSSGHPKPSQPLRSTAHSSNTNRTPAKSKPPTPLKSRPPTPVRSKPPTPAKSRPPTPARSRPPTPAKSRPPTPAKARPPTPVMSRSLTPARSKPPTPARSRPPTPVRSRSPMGVKSRPLTPGKFKPSPGKSKTSSSKTLVSVRNKFPSPVHRVPNSVKSSTAKALFTLSATPRRVQLPVSQEVLRPLGTPARLLGRHQNMIFAVSPVPKRTDAGLQHNAVGVLGTPARLLGTNHLSTNNLSSMPLRSMLPKERVVSSSGSFSHCASLQTDSSESQRDTPVDLSAHQFEGQYSQDNAVLEQQGMIDLQNDEAVETGLTIRTGLDSRTVPDETGLNNDTGHNNRTELNNGTEPDETELSNEIRLDNGTGLDDKSVPDGREPPYDAELSSQTGHDQTGFDNRTVPDETELSNETPVTSTLDAAFIDWMATEEQVILDGEDWPSFVSDSDFEGTPLVEAACEVQGKYLGYLRPCHTCVNPEMCY